ncbi:uncharacterized protein LOC143186037 [Calliopsis andreniformis]|uniref:uncharacterized protein LOC143186037 n=1 Tax=Calliopsis andreniformis TaxID=337506 RepID=UPI003FCE0D04
MRRRGMGRLGCAVPWKISVAEGDQGLRETRGCSKKEKDRPRVRGKEGAERKEGWHKLSPLCGKLRFNSRIQGSLVPALVYTPYTTFMHFTWSAPAGALRPAPCKDQSWMVRLERARLSTSRSPFSALIAASIC